VRQTDVPEHERVGLATYPLAADTLGPAEIQAAKAVLDSGYMTMGERVRQFEMEFAAWVGIEHAIMVNSGSSANLLIVDALLRGTHSRKRLSPGDEVLVPALAWPTTVWPLAQLGLVPVFCDVDPETLVIDLESAESALSPRTRALFIIHPLGRAADLTRISGYCEARDLQLLEDCCESLGSHWSGSHVGAAGVAGSFSFYFSHHISTIEGGMVVTHDQEMADDLRGLRAHGWIRDRTDREQWIAASPDLDARFLFATVGYNVRPTEIQGAIGTVQLRRLDEMLAAREALARSVAGWLAESAPWVELIGSECLAHRSAERSARAHSWMTLPLRVQADAPVDRNTVMRHLERHGVETRPIIAGNLARHPATHQITHRSAPDLSVSDALLRDTLMVGCHPISTQGSLETLEQAFRGLASF
jgi:dTDP-4-amino-4,6-dideoxygalactose transaminase